MSEPSGTRIDLGPASAYAYAKENGYTGTEAEFGQYLAEASAKAVQTVTNANAAASSAVSANSSQLVSEGYATGKQNGTDVTSQSPYYENNAKYHADRAATEAGKITSMTAQATTLTPGSSATASFANGVLTLGIPAGANGTNGTNGQDGQDGQDGADGYSPSASVSKSGKTTTITITDKNGTTTAQVVDGTEDVETVSGTTPSITGVANTRYMCGEVASISITPPQSGIIDVVFTSGTTPAVLTVPNTVKWPDWFDPTSLGASTTYEINIMDGIYGAVGVWA